MTFIIRMQIILRDREPAQLPCPDRIVNSRLHADTGQTIMPSDSKMNILRRFSVIVTCIMDQHHRGLPSALYLIPGSLYKFFIQNPPY